VLALSTSGEPDIVVHPDQGTVGVNQRRPDGSGRSAYFHGADAVDYRDAVDS